MPRLCSTEKKIRRELFMSRKETKVWADTESKEHDDDENRFYSSVESDVLSLHDLKLH